MVITLRPRYIMLSEHIKAAETAAFYGNKDDERQHLIEAYGYLQDELLRFGELPRAD